MKSLRFFPGKLILAITPCWNDGIPQVIQGLGSQRGFVVGDQLCHFSRKRTKGFQWFGAPAFRVLPWSCRGTLGWLNSHFFFPLKSPIQDSNTTSSLPRLCLLLWHKEMKKGGITFLCFLEHCPFKAEHSQAGKGSGSDNSSSN